MSYHRAQIFPVSNSCVAQGNSSSCKNILESIRLRNTTSSHVLETHILVTTQPVTNTILLVQGLYKCMSVVCRLQR